MNSFFLNGGSNLVYIIKIFIYVKIDFFCGVRGSNLGPCIYYALSIPTELCSHGLC